MARAVWTAAITTKASRPHLREIGGSEHFAQSGAARGDNNSRIGYYRFMVYGDDHQRAEDLGIRDMRDDADAQSFGYRVIRDLMQTDAGFYFGWTMDITAANRAVASIPFDAVETRH